MNINVTKIFRGHNNKEINYMSISFNLKMITMLNTIAITHVIELNKLFKTNPRLSAFIQIINIVFHIICKSCLYVTGSGKTLRPGAKINYQIRARLVGSAKIWLKYF